MMTTPARNLHIFYRHVHIKADQFSRDPNKARPAWFSHERCFRNLLGTILADPHAARVNITIMYDGSAEDVTTDFIAGYLGNTDYRLRLQLIQGGSDRNSFLITMAAIQQQAMAADDIVYILENDYMHVPGWVSKVFELYEDIPNFDMVSLYDHRDKYFLEMYRGLTAQITHSRSHHWRTTPSTCASFMLSRQAFDRDLDVLTAGLQDYFFFQKLVVERGRILLSPIPGLATHSMEGYLSPTIAWENFIV